MRALRYLGLVTALSAGLAVATPADAAVRGEIRVDQVGYAVGEAKHAYLLAPSAATGSRFAVLDGRGATVLSGTLRPSAGGWNEDFTAVHDIDFSRLSRPGSYRITVAGAVRATSPTFRIGSGAELFGGLVGATNEFFQAQRDGADIIPGRLDRKPSHLVDRAATVYEQPKFKGDGGDVPAEPLRPTGVVVDVEGGWADAGDYLKFTANTSYSLTEMIKVRQLGAGDRALEAEIGHGLRWLDKVWDARGRVLYAQVGLGTGSEEFNFLGDHDVWRLPEDDDARQTALGHPEFFVKHRPVFPANPGGAPLSPNLAGRVAAAFALGAQLEAPRNPRLARHYLAEAASVFAHAKTADVGELVTAFPHAYYPEESWVDDMELGATELALAGRLLGDARTRGWARLASHWAREYLASDAGESLNLYDTSALAHADLIRLLRTVGPVPGAEVEPGQLIADLRRQLADGAEAAARSPFGTAVDVTNFDAATRSFGFAATAKLYERATGDRQFAAFGVQQRNFVLGANAWGVSLVVGVGSSYPRCPHHQTANLADDGKRRLLYGAAINGPNGTDNFEFIGAPDGAKPCAVDYASFDGQGSRFMDDMRSWPSSEPAIDFTSTAMLAFALAAR